MIGSDHDDAGASRDTGGDSGATVDTHTDTTTGEIRPRRSDPDSGLHIEGDGEAAWGTKLVLVAARNTDPHGRVILDIEWVPRPGGEATTAMNCLTRVAPLISGAHGLVYDTALRGVHHQTLLRELGLLPINRVAAAHAGSKLPRRTDRRIEKSAYMSGRHCETRERACVGLSIRSTCALT